MSAPALPMQEAIHETPRLIKTRLHPTDRIFYAVARGTGILVLCLTGAIGLFLALQMIPTIHHYGFKFFTTQDWNPERNVVGVEAAIVGTIEVAIVTMIVAFPLALGTALFITEYAPLRLRSTLVAMIDLMAAVPSVIYGAWGLLLLRPHAIELSRWMAEYLGFIPIFKVDTDPHAPAWAQSRFTSSAFIAGIAVAMMVTPLACAVMRGVFAQTPAGEREAALALGGTRFGVIRSVVLPFGRGGIIGGTMLGLGRALGETITVLLIISPLFKINLHILQTGAITTSSLIADRFGEATSLQLKALLAVGFVLFVMTLCVNTIAGILVTRSRSGSATDA